MVPDPSSRSIPSREELSRADTGISCRSAQPPHRLRHTANARAVMPRLISITPMASLLSSSGLIVTQRSGTFQSSSLINCKKENTGVFMKKLPSRRLLLPLLIPFLAAALLFILARSLTGPDIQNREFQKFTEDFFGEEICSTT